MTQAYSGIEIGYPEHENQRTLKPYVPSCAV